MHDWDSLAWQPEAALAGGACAVFAKTGPVALPPVESSEAFLAAYQYTRGRSFTSDEWQIAWAAGIWSVAHDLRWEALHGRHVPRDAASATRLLERLERADA